MIRRAFGRHPIDWTPERIETMRVMTAAGATAAEVADALQLSQSAIAQKRRRLGFSGKSTERELNEQPWEPLPGMVKRRCERCLFLFATPLSAQAARCPECH